MTYLCLFMEPEYGCIFDGGACELEFCAGHHLECCQWCQASSPDHCGCCSEFDPDRPEAAP